MYIGGHGYLGFEGFFFFFCENESSHRGLTRGVGECEFLSSAKRILLYGYKRLDVSRLKGSLSREWKEYDLYFTQAGAVAVHQNEVLL